MCNSSTCSHDDLNDALPWETLEDESFTNRKPRALTTPAPDANLADALLDQAACGRVVHENRSVGAGYRYEEKCDKCRGTGRFVGYTGRVLGPCFTCEGKGIRKFKTSPEARAARNANERRAEQKAQSLRENAQLWRETNRADWNWMSDKAESFDFARSMVDALASYGTLTAKQHETVTRLRVRDEERNAARKVEAEQRAANAPAVDASRIAEAFATAQGNGVKRPRMVLNGFKISLAPMTGRNAGALYVVRVEDDQYLGKIMDGRFSRVRECDEATEARVVAVVNDPKGEAIAYGQRTGNCCICNRELTNHASIDAGIGPICAAKFGW